MNIGFWACICVAVPFAVMGILFAILKDRSAKLVSGFNSLPKDEQKLYDKAYIARDMRNSCLIWAGVLIIGALFSLFITQYSAIVAYIIFFILFFKQFHLDTHKAFEKHLKN